MSNLIYNTAPQDGTVMGLVQRGVLLSELTKQPGVRYQVSKFNWIGSVTSEVSLVASWHTSPVKTFKDLQTRTLLVGGTGATADTEASARVLNALAGAKFKIVSGYPGTADVLLAVQRGELEGIADLSWSEMKSKNADLLKNHDFNFLAQNTLVKSPDLPDVPLAMDFVTHDRPVAELYYAVKGVARPILMGPKVPAERIAAMRDAFSAMVADPGFLRDAKAMKLDLTPADFKAVNAFVSKAEATPPDVAATLTQILNLNH
jgi:tripartite-type tricarboxylate transporter receptor subunit TctC